VALDDDEELLPGNLGGVLRVGATVRRPTGPWTPAVHALLQHLADRVPHIPRVHGFDERGREVLDFLPGRVVDINSEALSEARLVALVAWVRGLHRAVADFTHPGPWRFFDVPGATLVGHNDLGYYNLCFAGDGLAGVFDWDLAGPTTPMFELAFLAWNGVPLWRDDGPEVAAARLRLIADTYGGPTAREILGPVPSRIELMLHGIPAHAARGDAGMARLMALGEPQRSHGTLDSLVPRIPLIDRALGAG
jgi:hypothetical protein